MRQRLIWGQGAGQAMEDAIVLVNCFNAYDFEKALQRYKNTCQTYCKSN